MADKLDADEQRILWEQFVDTYVSSQESYDTSVRTLSAAGVAVTVTLATALEDFGGYGVGASVLFLTSLGANLISYTTAQIDMRARLDTVAAGDRIGAFGNNWTKATTMFNFIAGATLLLGGGFLAYFVATAT